MWSLFCDTERNLIVACGASGLENSAAVLDTGAGREERGEMVCKAAFPRVTELKVMSPAHAR